MVNEIFIYGAGGFAREVAWLMDSSPELRESQRIIGFVDDAGRPDRAWPDPRPVMSYEDAISMAPKAGFVVGIGSSNIRRNITEKLLIDGKTMPTLVHSSVQVSERVKIGSGSIICAGCILTIDIVIGEHVHVNLDCTLGHDVRVGDYVTVSPGVHISGNVVIEDDVFIGTGAVILNGSEEAPLVVGQGSVIAAGACVMRSTEERTLYAGVPAVAKKQL